MGGGKRRPAPGKLMAVEKWEPPNTVSSLRSSLGFVNYYAVYVHKFAESVALLQENLKLPRELGKKGSKVRITWTEADQKAFDEIKANCVPV